MVDPHTSHVLDTLVGEQLSSVTFVQDYLQLDFDGKRLTLNVWPVICNHRQRLSIEDGGYRDLLCSIIGQEVTGALDTESNISLTFGDNSILWVDLTSQLDIERVVFEDTGTSRWAWW